MLVVNNENYDCKVYERLENEVEFSETPTATFRCRPANQEEKKSYRLMKGVETTQDSLYLIASNLPKDIKVGSMIKFNGDEKIIESVGYYYDMNRIVNASVMSEEAIRNKCPKGMTIR